MTSYEAGFYAPLRAAEDRHFWFRGRNRVIGALVRQITGGLRSGYRVLEIGCGNGNVLAVLEREAPRGSVVGLDLFAEGLRNARHRTSCPLVRADFRSPPFKARFHLIGLFDVVEHLADDDGLLRGLREMLEPGGRLLITVPAHRSLWSFFDEVARHQRRYEPSELAEKLSRAGYDVEYCSQYMMTIYPMMRAWRRLSGFRTGHGDGRHERDRAARELTVVPIVNGVLAFLISQEARLIARRKRLPFGSSLVAIARKPDAR